jgi:hypothetical protein
MDNSQGSSGPISPVQPSFDVGSLIVGAAKILTGKRSAIITVLNYTSLKLLVINKNTVHGEFAPYPKRLILPGRADVFGSQSMDVSLWTGTEGWVRYQGQFDIDAVNASSKQTNSMTLDFSPQSDGIVSVADPNIYFTIIWDNPDIGSNSASAQLVGNANELFKVRFSVGKGDTGAKFVFSILDAPFLKRRFNDPDNTQIKQVDDASG